MQWCILNIFFLFSEIGPIKRKARTPETEVCLSTVTAAHRSIFINPPALDVYRLQGSFFNKKKKVEGRVSSRVLAAPLVDRSGTPCRARKCRQRPQCCFWPTRKPIWARGGVFWGGLRWENEGLSGFLWEEFFSCAVLEWHQGAVNRDVAQAALRGVNEAFDSTPSGTGISTNHGGTRRGGGVQTERPTDGVCGDVRASEGSERSQLTFKQGCRDHPRPWGVKKRMKGG